MMTLIEEAERKLDRKQADKLARKLSKGKKFDFNDMRVQLQQMNDMGGMSAMMEKLPGMGALGQMPQAAEGMMDDKATKKMDAIISSMAEQERRFPDLISGSRKRRIAAGSGTQIPDVNRLLKQHKTMQKMMRKMTKKGGLAKMMRGLGGMKAPPPAARLR